MKMKLFSMAVLMLLSSLSFGFSGETKKSSNTAAASSILAKFVQENVEYPEFLKNEGIEKACMLIEFSVEENGEIEILNTNQSDERMKNYVIHQIENLNLGQSDYVIGETYMLKLNFQLL